jgi:hypothetical protein
MQVQPLLPCRSILVFPLASIVITDALCAIEAGAADSALAIGSDAVPVPLVATELSDAADFPLVDPALLQAASARIATPIASGAKSLDVMSPSF